jgi:hypothetical protein
MELIRGTINKPGRSSRGLDQDRILLKNRGYSQHISVFP